jgi:hypothetical protein
MIIEASRNLPLWKQLRQCPSSSKNLGLLHSASDVAAYDIVQAANACKQTHIVSKQHHRS